MKIDDHILKHKTIKLIEYNTGENLDGLGYDNDFLDTTQNQNPWKKVIDNMDFIEIKIFWNAKKSIEKTNDSVKIFPKDTW